MRKHDRERGVSSWIARVPSAAIHPSCGPGEAVFDAGSVEDVVHA